MTINLTARNWSPKAVPAVLGIGLILVPLVTAHAAEGHARGPSEIVFLCQIIALLVCGRLAGEVMQRIGQPAVIGQLIAGILLGPSFLGLYGRKCSRRCFRPIRRRRRCSPPSANSACFCCCC